MRRGAAETIIRGKNATNYGIGSALARLVGGQDVLETFPLPLNQEESPQLRDSAQVIRQALGDLGEK